MTFPPKLIVNFKPSVLVCVLTFRIFRAEA